MGRKKKKRRRQKRAALIADWQHALIDASLLVIAELIVEAIKKWFGW